MFGLTGPGIPRVVGSVVSVVIDPARAGPAPASSLPSTLAQYYAQRLDWKPCDQYFECAWLYVPFDYSRPAWRRFALPVVKLPAAGPGKRIGSLVITPGGA